MRETYIEMLNILANKKIIKLKISGSNNNDIKSIFEDKYTKDDFEALVLYLYKRNILETYDKVSKQQIKDSDYLTAIINWQEAYDRMLIREDNTMYQFMKNYKEAYSLLVKKSRHLCMLEYYQYIQPAQTIWSLDNLMFIVLSGKKHNYEGLTLEDVYMNLLIYTSSLPFAKTDVYSPDNYNIIIKSLTGNEINIKTLEEMKKIEGFINKANLKEKAEHIESDDIIESKDL